MAVGDGAIVERLKRVVDVGLLEYRVFVDLRRWTVKELSEHRRFALRPFFLLFAHAHVCFAEVERDVAGAPAILVRQVGERGVDAWERFLRESVYRYDRNVFVVVYKRISHLGVSG